MTSLSSMHETGHSKLVHWDDSKGWDGERGGRRVQDGGTHVRRAAGSERAGKMAAAVVVLRPLCRLCRVVLFLSQFYILSGGGELRAGGPGTAGGGRVREEGAGRCGRVRHGLPPPFG